MKELLVSEYAKLVGKSTSTIYKMVAQGQIQTTLKQNKKYIVLTEDESTLDSHNKTTKTPKGTQMKDLEKKIAKLEVRIEKLEKASVAKKKVVKKVVKKVAKKIVKKALPKKAISKKSSAKKINVKKSAPKKKSSKKSAPKKSKK